jgi:hypothetical protein
VNLTEQLDCEVTLPVPPFMNTSRGEVIEVVFWSIAVSRWVHIVSGHFQRDLPQGHVQCALGDLAWVESLVQRAGLEGLREAIHDLETCQMPQLD